jgi:hypothetical protein
VGDDEEQHPRVSFFGRSRKAFQNHDPTRGIGPVEKIGIVRSLGKMVLYSTTRYIARKARRTLTIRCSNFPRAAELELRHDTLQLAERYGCLILM